jgi:hypothetical protein
MKLKKYLITGAFIFLAVAFFGGNGSAYDIADYISYNQGDERIFLVDLTVISHSWDDPISVSYLEKRVVTGTEEVNGVETMKMEAGPLGSPPVNSWFYVMDSEGLKQYRDFNSRTKTDIIFDPPILIYPAQFDLGDVHQGTYSFTSYSTDDGSLIATGTGNNTACLESVEDVTVRWGGEFKDYLRIYFSGTVQQTNGWTGGMDNTIWYAPNVGDIKGNVSSAYRHPVEKAVTTIYSIKLISATIDGVHYGFPAILGGPQ